MWDPYAEFQTAILPNGLSVHVAQWPGRPWESIGFLVHSGAAQDVHGLEGTAHFVEHLVSQNAECTVDEIVDFFDDCGGNVKLGVTSSISTKYGFFVPTDTQVLAQAFDIFGYMLLSEKQTQKIEQERQVILREFDETFQVPFALEVNMKEREVLFPGYWYARSPSPLGTRETIARITQNDVQQYYDIHYTPANISIVCVGGMSLEEVMLLVSQSPFSQSKEGKRTPLPVSLEHLLPPDETLWVKMFPKEAEKKTNLYRSVARMPNTLSFAAVDIFRSMLYDVVFTEVREKRGWAYSPRTFVNRWEYFRVFAVQFWFDYSILIEEVEKVVEQCIFEAGQRDDLFEKFKHRNTVGCYLNDMSGTELCKNALTDLVKFQRIISLEEYVDSVRQVTMSDIEEIVRWMSREKRWTYILKVCS